MSYLVVRRGEGKTRGRLNIMSSPLPDPTETRRLLLDGHVQGVGYRPFVYRAAKRLGIRGEVRNISGQVEVLASAPPADLDAFARALVNDAPAIARPHLRSQETLPARDFDGFVITSSAATGERDIHLPPDYFACNECLHELSDPQDRRYAYPFINCTQCGPRYTLIEALPYDRCNTSMSGFPLCPACGREYRDPGNRRFHAEPVACPVCGPQLSFHAGRGRGELGAEREAALEHTLERLRAGDIVAIKGVGGYHLVCDATNEETVVRLRARKQRPHKPLAVMFAAPVDEPLSQLQRWLAPTGEQSRLLISTQRPIVLCARRPDTPLADAIAPGLDEIGAMLPYSPLHHLLLQGFGGPLVMTSGNISGEPVLTDIESAEQRLAPIADAFLHHNRPIVRPADDSVYRVIDGAPAPIRIGRGVAPLELQLPFALGEPVLALGGHMKNTVALAWERRLVLSPHIGDLDSPRALAVFEQVGADLQRLYGIQARRLLCDAHPGYTSSRWAGTQELPVTRIQHHRAHASALALDGIGNSPVDDAIVFAWDGIGLGDDGRLWGGETFIGRPGHWRRFACLRPFRLPGGDRAGREPWRSAAALHWELDQDYRGPDPNWELAHTAWEKGINAPWSHAAGRLFDAAAALIGLCDIASFEGQGPMWLEALVSDALANQPVKAETLPLSKDENGLLLADWSPLLPILCDRQRDPAQRASHFHETLAQTILALAQQARECASLAHVGLTGGVFQNHRLCERTANLLREDGFDLTLGRAVPVNDGGVSAGQVIEYAAGGVT